MFKAHLLEQRNRDVLLIEAFEWDIFGLQNIKIDSWNILLTLVILNDFGTNFVILLSFQPLFLNLWSQHIFRVLFSLYF